MAAARTTAEREIMRYHFGRMWPERAHPFTRASLRDNIRGQRAVVARLAKAELTKTETQALAAIRLVEADERARLAEMGVEGAETATIATGFRSILIAARVGGFGRRTIGEAALHAALQKLVKKKLVRRSTVVGMGGGFTTYVRKEES